MATWRDRYRAAQASAERMLDAVAAIEADTTPEEPAP